MALRKNCKRVGKMLTIVRTLKGIRGFPFKNRSVLFGTILNKEIVFKMNLYKKWI